MDRRRFFTNLAQRVARHAMDYADDKVRRTTGHWIRPPFAVSELDFLLKCTRCQACIDACSHDVLFSLPATAGMQAMQSPAMDLRHNACRLCPDWPCVNACESGALQYPNAAQQAPQLARVEIDPATCLPFHGPECGVCVSFCPVENAVTMVDNKPVIGETCCGCAQCYQACVASPKGIKLSSINPPATVTDS